LRLYLGRGELLGDEPPVLPVSLVTMADGNGSLRKAFLLFGNECPQLVNLGQLVRR
jgi:hypothetical protein